VFDIIARGPIPFVAALHGAVVGGGLEAAAAHIRRRSPFFGLPEGQRGIFVGGGGTVRVQRIIGCSVMADMMPPGGCCRSRKPRSTIVRCRGGGAGRGQGEGIGRAHRPEHR
jgi:enoyl-CoA hydratase/carnithine racemase